MLQIPFNSSGIDVFFCQSSGGHLEVCQLLFSYGADVDSQDNRKVSVLMAAFRKGHIKVIKWLVKHVHQFPSDSECTRFISTISDKVSKCWSTNMSNHVFLCNGNAWGSALINQFDVTLFFTITNE